MSQAIRVLKTSNEYQAAIKRMSALMDQEIEPGSAAEAEFELLELVISAFDAKAVPKARVTPLEAIQFRMDQQGLTRKDLVPFIGSLPKVSEVLSGERPLSLAMVKRLHKGLGIPAAALLGEDDLED